MTQHYDPDATLSFSEHEEAFRDTGRRVLAARIYRPEGDGPFPVVLDLHGGAWNAKDRTANARMDRALAGSGILVVAIDLRLAEESPYPGSVQDAHLGVRWLKAKAATWGGDPDTLGVLGSSSGGHVAQLLALRPDDARYAALGLPETQGHDATVRYVATRSPISDPRARYDHAVLRGREGMMAATHAYFDPFESIDDGNPQAILERGEAAALPPMLIMQGALDDNVLPALQERFRDRYVTAGGECQLEIFADSDHMWVAEPGPRTDAAHAVLKAFIARSLHGR